MLRTKQICWLSEQYERKHDVNHGDGKDTDKRIKQFYQKVADDRLDAFMHSELSKYEESSASKKYWIPNDMTVEDIIKAMKKYFFYSTLPKLR